MAGTSLEHLEYVLLQTVWIVDSITWTVLWPMIEQTTSGPQGRQCRPNSAAHVTSVQAGNVGMPEHITSACAALQALSLKGCGGCSSASRHTCSTEAMQPWSL